MEDGPSTDAAPDAVAAEKGQEETRRESAPGAVVESAVAAASAAAQTALDEEEAEGVAAPVAVAAESDAERELVPPTAPADGAAVALPADAPATGSVDFEPPQATLGAPPAEWESAPSDLEVPSGFPAAAPAHDKEEGAAGSAKGTPEAYVDGMSRAGAMQPELKEDPLIAGMPVDLIQDENAGVAQSEGTEDDTQGAAVLAGAPTTPSADGSFSDNLRSDDSSDYSSSEELADGTEVSPVSMSS